MILYNVLLKFWCNECETFSGLLYTWITEKALFNGIADKKCKFCGKKLDLVAIKGRVGQLGGYKDGYR